MVSIYGNVPEKYLSHFVRRFFDGDGNTSYQRKIITLVGGSEKFKTSFKLILERYDFEPVFKKTSNHNYRIFISAESINKSINNLKEHKKPTTLFCVNKREIDVFYFRNLLT
nr:LAGLIDADG family homing endonuclease [Fictibacillus sp. 26RED30]